MTHEAQLHSLYEQFKGETFSVFKVDTETRALLTKLPLPTTEGNYKLKRVASTLYKVIPIDDGGPKTVPVAPEPAMKVKPLPTPKLPPVGHSEPPKDPVEDKPLPATEIYDTEATLEVERFPFFKDATKERSGGMTINELVEGIRSGPNWKASVERYRQLLSVDPERAKDNKPNLPAFFASADSKYERKLVKDYPFTHTGLIQCDFDDHNDYDRLIKELADDPHMRLIFRSPSHKVKALIKVAGIGEITTDAQHKAAFSAVETHCFQVGYGPIDERPKGINSLCFVSHDPHAILKDATPLPWEMSPPKQRDRRHLPPVVFTGKETSLTEKLRQWKVNTIGSRMGSHEGTSVEFYHVECPWINEHTQGEAVQEASVWTTGDGKWCFRCFHNHCADRGWQDFRQRVAPRPDR